MKKYLFCAAIAAAALVSCNKDKGGDSNGVKELDATFIMTTELASVVYAEPVEIVGTAASESVLDGCTLVAVKKSGETYTEVGEAQEGKIDGDKLTAQFFTDSKEMTDIAVTLKSGNAQKTFYCPVGEVTGELKGHVYYNETASLTMDALVKNHLTSPDIYPEEGTGAGSQTKSFFCMHGIKVNGERKHIVCLDELRAVEGQNFSMGYGNCWKGTDKPESAMAFLGNPGPLFYYGKEWTTSGSIGRQCDGYEVGGHKINPANTDVEFRWEIVKGSWAGESYNEAKYKQIDRLFTSIKEPDNATEEMKAYWQLGEIQRELDNSTLFNENEPTSLKLGNLLRVWTNAKDNKDVEPSENLRAGDYFIIRSKRGDAETGYRYYYGLIQIVQLPDVSIAWTGTNKGGFACFGNDDLDKLFGKNCYMSIKSQFEIPAE